MSMQRILSVDTRYDESSRWIADGRDSLYDRIDPDQRRVLRMGELTAEHDQVLRELRRTDEMGDPYRAIVVSSHGRPSQVMDDDSPGGLLLSERDSDESLALWARGRVLYFCCCETAQGPLFDRLVQLGAMFVVGFTGSPGATTDEGKRMWWAIDQGLVNCIFDETYDFDAVRRSQLREIDDKLLGIPAGDYRDDLESAKGVLSTMSINNK